MIVKKLYRELDVEISQGSIKLLKLKLKDVRIKVDSGTLTLGIKIPEKQTRLLTYYSVTTSSVTTTVIIQGHLKINMYNILYINIIRNCIISTIWTLDCSDALKKLSWVWLW